MDNRFKAQDQKVTLDQIDRGHLVVWSACGPLFLFIAFALILFRSSWELWPFVAASSLGIFATLFFRRTGFFLSLATLGTLGAFQYQILIQQPWTALFLAGSILSWGITLICQEEIGHWFDSETQKSRQLQQDLADLEQKMAESSVYLQQEPWDCTEEFKAALASRDAAVDNQNRAYEELEKLREQCIRLREEVEGYQRKEKAFQVALEDAQAQVLRFKYAESLKPQVSTNPIISQEEHEESFPAPSAEARQLEHQHTLLKEQFEEKSEALNQARKELFRLEGELFLMQREQEEQQMNPPEGIREQPQLEALLHQCETLEAEVLALEEIISSFAVKKKPVKPRRTKAKKNSLPEMLQEAIDQTSKQYSLLDE